ncbi:MAG: hypothetical protein ACJA2K_002141 [Thalassolituus sp.]|jgi:hypothetical protein|tara:strand:+ start:1279 stop:1380 length:102 start_codon:yes stop_codon:yes gene_type:complete
MVTIETIFSAETRSEIRVGNISAFYGMKALNPV